MTFKEYQEQANNTAMYPTDKGLEYLVLGLTSEAGEIAGKLKKVIRDEAGKFSSERLSDIEAELGDVLWYIAQAATELGMSLEDVAANNLGKLASRKERGQLQGSGDNR